MTNAAHCSQGEVERIVEVKVLQINRLMVENWDTTKKLYKALNEENEEYKVQHEKRWHEGMLRWKKERHITAME